MGDVLRMLFWFVIALLYLRGTLIEFGSWDAASDDARWWCTFGLTVSGVGLILELLKFAGVVS